MGKRKHSKITQEHTDEKIELQENNDDGKQADNSSLLIENQVKQLVSGGSMNIRKKNKLNNDMKITLELSEQWKQVLNLQDTLILILSYVPDYLLMRTMRFVNREFSHASTTVRNEYKSSVSTHVYSPEDVEDRLESWKQYKQLKRMKIVFMDGFDCDMFDASCLCEFGVERLVVRNSVSKFSKSLIGSQWSQTLKHLEIDMDQQYFNLLFDLHLTSLEVKFHDAEDNDNLHIGHAEKPLFTSLTSLDYSNSSFINMDKFLMKLVNLTSLKNDSMDMIEAPLPNLRSYGCIHELYDIKVAFPKLEILKSYSTLTIPDVLRALSLKTLKVVKLNLESRLFNLLPNALFELTLLEKLSLLIVCTTENTITVPTKPLPNLKSLSLSFFECENTIPISSTHFSKCTNIESIKFEDQSQRACVDLNDFKSFPLLKKLSVVSDSVINWYSPISTLESLKINTVSNSYITLTGINLKNFDFISGNMANVVQYFDDPLNNTIRYLTISGKGIAQYNEQTFPSNLEKLTITNLTIKPNETSFTNLMKKQTNLKKLVIEESKFDLVSLLESLTCLIHQVQEIQIGGECPTPYSESKYITKLLRVLSIYDAKGISLMMCGFNFTFSHQGTSYLVSQITTRFTTIKFS